MNESPEPSAAGPAITSSKVARSYGVFAIGPAESMVWLIGMTPSWDTSPMVGLIVYRAALAAGDTRDPSVSVPIESGAYPAETATADPVDDPQGF